MLGNVVELHDLPKDGREFPPKSSLAAWMVGTQAFFTGIVRDIPDWKRTEEVLMEAHEPFRALIQASPLPLFPCDPGGRVTLWNRTGERIFGWRDAELMGHLLPSVPAGKQGGQASHSGRVGHRGSSG